MSPAELTAWATVAIAIVTAGVGFTTCFLVWHGIREMRRSSEERARDRKVFADAEGLRHEEVMEALSAQSRISDAQSRILETQSRALEALIERTARPAPAE